MRHFDIYYAKNDKTTRRGYKIWKDLTKVANKPSEPSEPSGKGTGVAIQHDGLDIEIASQDCRTVIESNHDGLELDMTGADLETASHEMATGQPSDGNDGNDSPITTLINDSKRDGYHKEKEALIFDD